MPELPPSGRFNNLHHELKYFMPEVTFSLAPWHLTDEVVSSAEGTPLFNPTPQIRHEDLTAATAAPEMFAALREVRRAVAGYLACGDEADHEALYRALDHADRALNHARGLGLPS